MHKAVTTMMATMSLPLLAASDEDVRRSNEHNNPHDKAWEKKDGTARLADGQCWAVKNGRMLPMRVDTAKKYGAKIFYNRKAAEEYVKRVWGNNRARCLQGARVR